MSGVLEFTVLGSGSSGGVPRADGNWGVCDPANPKNRRSRCSLLVRRRGEGAEDETSVLVDTSPDLRLQTAAAGAKRLDAVLYTHDHADQAHGIDDLRAFFLRWRRRLPCYMDAATRLSLERRFGYIFESHGGYPAICAARDLPPHGQPWIVNGPSGDIPVMGFDLDHGEIRSVGFRFGPVAYCPDVLNIPEPSFAALAGVRVWIVDALRDTPHPTHAHVERTLEWIARVKPARAILTNLHIDLDYAALTRRLPAGVEAAYDGLRFETELA
jgi:phosphoribosyl 1,2-cyclic phosphate phosphodiesterase